MINLKKLEVDVKKVETEILQMQTCIRTNQYTIKNDIEEMFKTGHTYVTNIMIDGIIIVIFNLPIKKEIIKDNNNTINHYDQLFFK